MALANAITTDRGVRMLDIKIDGYNVTWNTIQSIIKAVLLQSQNHLRVRIEPRNDPIKLTPSPLLGERLEINISIDTIAEKNNLDVLVLYLRAAPMAALIVRNCNPQQAHSVANEMKSATLRSLTIVGQREFLEHEARSVQQAMADTNCKVIIRSPPSQSLLGLLVSSDTKEPWRELALV